jgi:hypothetical protein
MANGTEFDDETLDFVSDCFLAVANDLADQGIKPDDETMNEAALALLSKASEGEGDANELVAHGSKHALDFWRRFSCYA